MWKELIETLTDDRSFQPPASPVQLAEAEESLGVALPEELKSLLLESNGVEALYGAGLIWAAEDIAKQNLEYRSFPDFKELYMPFDPLLFFGDEGNGSLYAFIIIGGVIRRPDIFLWDHETDSRQLYAANLQRYLERRLKDE